MRLAALLIPFFILIGCNSLSSTNTKVIQATDPSSVIVTEEDIPEKKYDVLKDIKITVKKSSLFHEDPSVNIVEGKLKLKAAELGANAIIFVHYEDVGVSLMSRGAITGKGKAIVFIE